MKTDRVVPSPFLPSRLFSAVVPENRIVRLVLGIIAAVVIVKIFQSLKNRVIPSASSPEGIRNAAAERCLKQGSESLKKKKFDEAFEHLSQGYKLNPTTPNLKADICALLARHYINKKLYDQATVKIGEIFAAHPTDKTRIIWAHTQRGLLSELRGEYAEALVDLEQALLLETRALAKSEIQLIIARLFCRKDEFVTAMEKSKEVAAQGFKDEELCPYFMELARLCSKKNQFEHAHEYIENAFAACPDEAHVLKADLNYAKALIYNDQKDYPRCWQSLTAAYEIAKNLDSKFAGNALFQRALVREQIAGCGAFPEETKYKDVLEDLAAALTIVPRHSDLVANILLIRAGVYQKMGNRVAAIEDLQATETCCFKRKELQAQIDAKLQELKALTKTT